MFNKIRIKLDEKEQELLNKLDEIEKYKKKELELQKEDLKFGIESIIGSCQMIEQAFSLSTQNDMRLLSMKKLYQSRLNYLSNNIWRIEPCYNPLIDFSVCEESIYSSISNIGIVDSNTISIEKCLISRNGIQKAFVDNEFKFEIISYSKEGNQMRKGGHENQFKIQIKEESNEECKEDKYEWRIKDLNNGRYKVKMKLKDEGKYLIFVQYNEINLLSSPIKIQVFSKSKKRNYDELKKPKLSFGSEREKTDEGVFDDPWGITIDSKGNILVCEHAYHRIQIFDSKGKSISMFGSEGDENGQFNRPVGITINSKGNILVSDRDNDRIQIFDSEGKFISTFGSYGDENGEFYGPEGICTDIDDNIYVCDSYNDRIQIFDPEGNFLSTFGTKGNENGQFDFPNAIAINSKGNIIVGEYFNNRIQIFNSQGVSLSTFGLKGTDPKGMCVDLDDNILICNYEDDKIDIFNSSGIYLMQWKVQNPMAIVIDPRTQDIIVCGNEKKVSIY